jgi:hypothetical protein
MSREIKFKYYFKNKVTGEITSQIFTLSQLERGDASFIHLHSQQLKIKKRCQFSGDTDNKYKEIYEGDKMKFLWRNEVIEGIVYFDDKRNKFTCTSYEGIPSHGEVICSIHDKCGDE